MKSGNPRAATLFGHSIMGSNPDTSTNRKIRPSSEGRISFVIAHFTGFFRTSETELTLIPFVIT